jgi:hypothetical protein
VYAIYFYGYGYAMILNCIDAYPHNVSVTKYDYAINLALDNIYIISNILNKKLVRINNKTKVSVDTNNNITIGRLYLNNTNRYSHYYYYYSYYAPDSYMDIIIKFMQTYYDTFSSMRTFGDIILNHGISIDELMPRNLLVCELDKFFIT